MANGVKRVGIKQQDNRLPPIKPINQKLAPYADLYHVILRRPWWQFIALVSSMFFLSNALFALAFLAQPGSIANARPGNFEDAFSFSVQTMATIGYGLMAPATRYAHLLVTLEALTAILSFAVITGVTFARFARPTARVLFSEKIVVNKRNGVPHLCFRMANWRHNQIVEANLRMIVLVSEVTAEGETLRRPVDVPLVRSNNPTFFLTWLAMHKIDEQSLFHGDSALQKLRDLRAEIYLTLSGVDETFGQQIHTRHGYSLDDIVWNARFRDVITLLDDGTRVLDYSQFHQVDPLAAGSHDEVH